MPSRRSHVAMTQDEIAALLSEGRTLVLGSHGPRGTIHMVPLWYVVLDGVVWSWTYARSQKARNLAREATASGLVELGDRYDELRGVLIEGRAVLSDDPVLVRRVGEGLLARYELGSAEAAEAMRRSASKRVAIRLEPERIVSWDHRKLGGRY
ncbi:pyridoxamine 5'-phosphate oxidase-related FMN- binding [Acidimicrobium ferrooxidans DSM 10331]|uniref:Pyridoxamine 5'-phosphate oxidase-related FMN-binding n=2 Tax=Acidimicrobium ferrooxidans TaxID=53635 RepID=C7M150_ACIFD|nr:pyridoxamine 5'-phosphate oxidase-related FMN- binding [Acidimicrobium ferrooxidans DSM 10331]